MSHIIPLVRPDTVWLTRGPVPTATAIGVHKGWFERVFADLGYRTGTLQDSRDAAMRSQHFYHDIKTLIREGGNVLPLWRRAHNLKTKGWDNTVVVGLTWVDEVQVLMARPGSGLRLDDSLKDKRFALTNSAGEIDVWRAMALRAYETALGLAGIGLDDMNLVNVVAPPVQWQDQSRIGGTGWQHTERALLAGEVDIIYARGVAAIQLQQTHGLEVVLDINSLDDPKLRINNGTPRLLTIHKHFLDDHPELVSAYLKVVNAAAAWAPRHEADVAAILAAETSGDPKEVLRGYGPRLASSFDVNLNAMRVSALQDQADFLLRHGLIDVPVDVRDWINAEPLLQAFANPLNLDDL